jgi:hypothetical protein
MNVLALIGGLGQVVVFVGHGVIGHGWLTRQLDGVTLKDSLWWRDPDLARRVMFIAWHFVSITFLAFAIALVAIGAGELQSRALLRFIALCDAAFAIAGAAILGRRILAAARAPMAIAAVPALVLAAVMAWIAAG